MSEFDWVTARSECSLVTIFERLKLQLQDDVDKRMALRGEAPFNYAFKLVIDGKGAAVVLEGPGLYDSTLFRLTNKAIEIMDKDGKVKFAATPTLNDDGECRLSINGQELDLWQFRKKALETLFFLLPEVSVDQFAKFGGRKL
jgi:hypothetical protein